MTTIYSKNQKELLRKILSHTELNNPSDAYKISHAGTKESWFSVGTTQVDLGAKKIAKSWICLKYQ